MQKVCFILTFVDFLATFATFALFFSVFVFSIIIFMLLNERSTLIELKIIFKNCTKFDLKKYFHEPFVAQLDIYYAFGICKVQRASEKQPNLRLFLVTSEARWHRSKAGYRSEPRI